MKLALIFLLSLASLSVQQKLRYNPYLEYAFPRALSSGYYFYGNPYARYQPPEVYSSEDDESDNYYDIADQLEARAKYQNKQLLNFIPSNPFRTVTVGTVVISTSPISTVVVATVQKCITSTYFAPGASTVSCGRRRRNIFVEEEAEGASAINPSAVNPIEPTPVEEKKYRDDTQIEASHESAAPVRRARLFWPRPVTVTTTATSYVPGYSFSTTVIKSTVAILSSAATSALSCLPAGYTYC